MQLHRFLPRIILPGLMLLCIYLIAAMAPGAYSQGTRQVWARQYGLVSDTIHLNDVHMLDENNIWLGGYAPTPSGQGTGYVLKAEWRDERWSISQTYTFTGNVDEIFVVSDSDVWALLNPPNSDGGHILHKSGDRWNELVTPFQYVHWSTVWMSPDGKHGWIGGSRVSPTNYRSIEPLLFQYENGELSREISMEGHEGLSALDVEGNVGWAVGGDSSWRFNGNRWDFIFPRRSDPPGSPPCGHLFYPCLALSDVHAVSYDEAWAVGTRLMGDPNRDTGGPQRNWSEQTILHAVNGEWQQVLPGQPIVSDPYAGLRSTSSFRDLGLSEDGYGYVLGSQVLTGTGRTEIPYVLSLRQDGRWHYEQLPGNTSADLRAVASIDLTHAVIVGSRGLILTYGYGDTGPTPVPVTPSPTRTPVVPPPVSTSTGRAQPTVPPASSLTPVPGWKPTLRISDPHLPGVLYFSEAGHTLRGDFRAYWEQHGGLEQFGYPLTEEFHETFAGGKAILVQYFERARFEWHKENVQPYRVLLGLLGHEMTQGRVQEEPFKAAPARTEPGGIYFPETQHNMLPQFAAYWQSHGGLPVYGYPISEPFPEVSKADGKTYMVQYFQRNRFEYHPENSEPFKVLLGHLGTEVLWSKGWLP